MADSIYGFSAKANDGSGFSFDSLRGKVILVVNTASKCGFTPQYQGLEALHRKYKDQGLAVIGFPCDQFGHQEPGDDGAIKTFCELNYGVSFPLMSKVEVNGPGAHPVFIFLKKAAPKPFGGRIKWNFTKFLVTRDGAFFRRYAPTTEPQALEADIEKALAG
jgi:glutathione peroxidase